MKETESLNGTCRLSSFASMNQYRDMIWELQVVIISQTIVNQSQQGILAMHHNTYKLP